MANKSPNVPDHYLQTCANYEANATRCANNTNGNTDYLWQLEVLPVNQTRPIEASSVVPAHVLFYILMFNFWGPGLGTCVFGIITNILNITTFLKQSLHDAVNISLLGLAISDLGSLLTIFIVNICFLPQFQALDLPFVVMDFMYMWAWVHVILTRVSA